MFTDNFNRANENLEASANWTIADGTAAALTVTTNAIETHTNTDTLYVCPDQGSANHYSQASRSPSATSENGFPLVVRATDAINYIGVRLRDAGATIELYKRDAGAFTLLDNYSYTHSAGDVWKLEATANTITVYVNTVSVISVTESFNNTETRQGILCRDTSITTWLDDFEADVTYGITSSPATVVDGETGFTIVTAGMGTITTCQLRSKQDNNHAVDLSFSEVSGTLTVDSPDFKTNTNTTTGIDGCPFTTAYDTLEFYVSDGTLTTTADVIFNPATGWDEVKVSTTPDMTSASISENFNGYYEDITVVDAGNPTTLTITDHGFTDGQEITVSGLDTTDATNGEHVFTEVNENSGTIPVNVTTVVDDIGNAQTGVDNEHGQFLFSTDDSGAMTADGLYSHSKTANHYVQYFDYVDSKMKAVLVTVLSARAGNNQPIINFPWLWD